MTVKRRTIWVTDEEWSKMRTAAVERGLNVSRLIRSVVLRDGTAGKLAEGALAQAARPTRQAERDAILRKVNRPG